MEAETPPVKTKKKKSAKPPVKVEPPPEIENLGTDEIRIETPVLAEETPKKPKKTVGFAVQDDDDTDRRRIRKTIYQKPTVEDVDDPEFTKIIKTEEKKITERETEIEKKEPWDQAKVEPDPIELNKIPSPWPHYFRIYVHRFFSLLFLIISMCAATFQYVSSYCTLFKRHLFT